MAFSVISISSDSSEESTGTSAGRVILFGNYTPASPDYSPASDTKSVPSEDPSSDHIPPLPASSPFLSSTNYSLDSDTLDTPPTPTHGTPFTEITPSTQSSPAASGAICRRFMILARDSLFPTIDLTSTILMDLFIYSLSEASLDFHSVASPNSPSKYSSSGHSSPNSPCDSLITYARPSRMRHRSLTTSRIRDSDSLIDVEVGSGESSEPFVPKETDLGVDDDVEESITRGMVEVEVDPRVGPLVDDDVHETIREDVHDHATYDGAADVTYETLQDLEPKPEAGIEDDQQDNHAKENVNNGNCNGNGNGNLNVNNGGEIEAVCNEKRSSGLTIPTATV
nr:hypothetical protein [Tanacetum cinerariifolium]